MKISLMCLHSHGTNRTVPPIGLGYLASLARNAGHSVDVCGPLDIKRGEEHMHRYLKTFKPCILGVNVFSCDIDIAQQVLAIAKKSFPQIVTVLGGPHPSCAPDTVFDLFPNLDYAFRGEAEPGFLRFLEMLQTDSPNWSDIPGLIWRRPDTTTAVNDQDMVENLDELPFPAWDLMDPRRYMASMYYYTPKLPAPPVLATRGCPFKCTFCANHCITGRKVRKRSVENIVQELQMLKGQYEIRGFQFVDDNVAYDGSFLERLCDRIIEDDLNLQWSCPVGLRISSISAELLKKMEKAGCIGISIGIESGSQRILDMIKKQTTVQEICQTVDMVRLITRMRILGHFILGFPSETSQEVDKTIQFACSLPLDLASFYLFKPVPGTELWHQLQEEGVIDSAVTFSHLDWRSSLSQRSFCTMSKEELHQKYRKAYFRFYMRFRVVWNMLKSVRTHDQLLRIWIGLKRLFAY